MARRLAKGEETVKLEIKLPSSLKKKAISMATGTGDGDVASWLRELIRREWAKGQSGRELAALTRGKR